MKTKKNANANLERSRGLARQMGLILALGFLFIAFEYSNADISDPGMEYAEEVYVEEDYVPITKELDPVQLPPPPNVSFEELIIVDNNLDIPDIIEIIDIDDYDLDNLVFDTPDEVDPDEIFIVVEDKPEFPGGDAALMRYLSKNVNYPVNEQELGISGRVFVEFVVNKDGSIVDVQILKGVSRGLDDEAMRVIRNMPNWKPGAQRGETVRVSYRIPINFTLR